jgi:hypothetical protein
MKSVIIAAIGFILLLIGAIFLGALVQDLIIELRFEKWGWTLGAGHIAFDLALMLFFGAIGEFLMRKHMKRLTVRIIVAILAGFSVLGGLLAAM